MPKLRRELGLFSATMMGLGSIVGTGVFVSIGLGAGVAGPGVVLAIVAAALVATCNALSSAQLAASHPVSGGTYEYGYRYLKPWLGFSAGWMFLCAKTASAATAALGFAGYLLNFLGLELSRYTAWQTGVAVAVVLVLTLVVATGMRQSSRLNVAVVAVALGSLSAFVLAGSTQVSLAAFRGAPDPIDLFHATALMFVAYTGYGRIATLGEEVRQPRRTIPRAIVATLAISLAVYVGVAVVAVGTVGAPALAAATRQTAAPLETVSRSFPIDVHQAVAIGAMAAMLGVSLNLLLGLSRVVLAMGRRRDLPAPAGNLAVAVAVTGLGVAALAATGSVKLTWSFSAFTVLIYYAVTNLAALRLPPGERLYSRWWARGGLAACLALAFSIEWQVWSAGLAVLGAGLVWHRHRQGGIIYHG